MTGEKRKGVEELEWDNGIDSVIDTSKPKQDKVVVADFDSLVYFASYTGYDDYGNKCPDYREDEYEVAEGILTDKILSILSEVEKYFNISQLYICVKSLKAKNFRKELSAEYKAQRPVHPPIINHLVQFLVDKYSAIEAHKEVEGKLVGFEADDTVYSIHKSAEFDSIVLYFDEDMLAMPGIFYNYQKNKWCKIDQKEANYRKALKTITGCTSDNVKTLKGIGPKKAAKIINDKMTKYQYIRAIYQKYVEFYGDEASNKLRLVNNLTALHDINTEF